MTVADMVARSSDLKRELVAFARLPRFAKAFRRVLADVGDKPTDETRFVTIVDSFIMQHRLPDGRTVLDHFIDARTDLAEADREFLRGWRNVVEGLFEVQRQDGDALILHNAIDELTYRTHSNLGSAAFARMSPGSFLVGRLVPVGDEWLFTGHQMVLPASARRGLARAAADFALANPRLIFRNPEKLKLGWELQRDDRALFVEFFGSDVVTVAGAQFAERMREFWDFRNSKAAERTGRHGQAWPIPQAMSPDSAEARTVGMIYDETEGLTLLNEFGVFSEAFDEPDRVRRQPHRGVVRGYLNDDGVSPLPFRRLAARDPEKASRVFQLLLKRPDFSWEPDGETLLKKRKAEYFDTPPLPCITPITGLILEHYESTSSSGEKDRRGSRLRGSARGRELSSARGTARRRPRGGKGGSPRRS
jgi:hypothetical protein